MNEELKKKVCKSIGGTYSEGVCKVDEIPYKIRVGRGGIVLLSIPREVLIKRKPTIPFIHIYPREIEKLLDRLAELKKKEWGISVNSVYLAGWHDEKLILGERLFGLDEDVKEVKKKLKEMIEEAKKSKSEEKFEEILGV